MWTFHVLSHIMQHSNHIQFFDDNISGSNNNNYSQPTNNLSNFVIIRPPLFWFGSVSAVVEKESKIDSSTHKEASALLGQLSSRQIKQWYRYLKCLNTFVSMWRSGSLWWHRQYLVSSFLFFFRSKNGFDGIQSLTCDTWLHQLMLAAYRSQASFGQRCAFWKLLAGIHRPTTLHYLPRYHVMLIH